MSEQLIRTYNCNGVFSTTTQTKNICFDVSIAHARKIAEIRKNTLTNTYEYVRCVLLLTTSVQQINLHKHMRLCVYICIFPYVTGILCNSQNNHRFAVYQTVWHYPSNGVNIKAQPLRWVKFVWGNFPCEIWCEWLWTSVEQLQILY